MKTMGNVRVVVAREVLERLGCDIVVHINLDCGDGISLSVGEDMAGTAGNDDMLAYMEVLAAEKERRGRTRTAETYRATLTRWRDFLTTKDGGGRTAARLPWTAVSASLMEGFADYLRRRGAVDNTQAFYFRRLRAVCNRARKEGREVATGLFDGVYTGMAKTVKRALTATEMRRVATAKPKNEREARARDLFVFSFLTRGMSMVDIAHLSKADITGSRLRYTRKKTGRPIGMEYTAEMKAIADKYKDVSGHRLFPLMSRDDDAGRREYRRAQSSVNYYLKGLGRRLGLRIPLTMYVARHSWATIAKAFGVHVAVISDALGHNSERTTQIYLDSIDTGRIDAVNRKLARKVLGCSSGD